MSLFVSVFVIEKSSKRICSQFVANIYRVNTCRECFRAETDHESELMTLEDHPQTTFEREIPAMLQKPLERVSNDNIQVRQNRSSRNNPQSKFKTVSEQQIEES